MNWTTSTSATKPCSVQLLDQRPWIVVIMPQNGRGQPISLQSTSAVRGREIPPMARKDQLVEAKHIRKYRIYLRFADGLEGTWSFDELGLRRGNVQFPSVELNKEGTGVYVKSNRGQIMCVDAASLRAPVDPSYAAELEEAFVKLRGPL
jgi:hypothetical protein